MDANLLYFLLGIFAMIPIDLLVLPRLRKWQNDLPVVSRQKRQKELSDDLAHIGDLYKDRNKLIATAAAHTITIVAIYTVSLVMLTTSMFFLVLDTQYSILQFIGNGIPYTRKFVYASDALIVIGFVLFMIGLNLSFKIIGILNRIKQYETFKQQTEIRIQELAQEK